MKSVKIRLVVILILAICQAMGTSNAATFSSSTNAPPVDGEDIANLVPTTNLDKWWAENSGAGQPKGQTFMPTNVVTLNAITYRVGPNSKAQPTKVYRIRVGVVDEGTSTFHEFYIEEATQSSSWGTNSYGTWTFETPPTLQSNVLYGVDIAMKSSTSGWQTGIPYITYTGSDTYPGGTRYTTTLDGIGYGTPDMNIDSGRDREFHLDMAAYVAPPDTNAPSVVSIVDNAYGGPLWQDATQLVYTVSFDEVIDASTVDAADFETVGSGVAITIGTITKTTPDPTPSAFDVVVAPSGTGTLQFAVQSGSDIADMAANAVVSPAVDDTVITVNAGSSPPTTISGTASGNDSWNDPANWDNGLPWGPQAAVVASGIEARVENSDTPVYNGGLTFESSARLRVGWTVAFPETANALGTSNITMNAGSELIAGAGLGTHHFDQHFILNGDATIWAGTGNVNHHTSKYFDGGISGPGKLTYNGVNNTWFHFTVDSPDWEGGFRSADPQGQGHQVKAVTNGCFGTGSVTISTNCSLETASLLVDAIGDKAALIVEGQPSTRLASKLVLNSDDQISEFWLDGVQKAPGVYNSATGLRDSNNNPLITGDGSLIVVPALGDGLLLIIR